MGSVTFINRIDYKFITIPVFHESKVIGKEEPDRDQLCLIAMKYILRDRIVIHQFSEFILQLKGKEFNTMKARADTVVRFLNFVLKKKKEHVEGYTISSFAELNKLHATDYLNSMVTKGCSPRYRNSEENNLTKFYEFLAKKEVLNSIRTDEFTKSEIKVKGGGTKQVLEAFFTEAKRSKRKKSAKKLHYIEDEYIPLLLYLAEVHVPHIALAVYFAIFGGLRVSEVCSCFQPGISPRGPFGSRGMNVTVITRNRRKKPSRNAPFVKVDRVQSIKPYSDWLPRLYRQHIDKYLPTDGSPLLFSNKSGGDLSPAMLEYYFNKLKEKFLSCLESSKDVNDRVYATTLRSIDWSFHIGRGMFSNIMAEIKSEAELMIERGDHHPDSVRPYKHNTKQANRKTCKHLDHMYKRGIRRLKETGLLPVDDKE